MDSTFRAGQILLSDFQLFSIPTASYYCLVNLLCIVTNFFSYLLKIGKYNDDKKLFTNPIFCGIIIKLAQRGHNNRGGDYYEGPV